MTTSREAQMRLAPGSHRLVIADLCLPDGSSYQVAELAEALGIKAVLMSGDPDEMHVVQLAKPLGLAEFVGLLAKAYR